MGQIRCDFTFLAITVTVPEKSERIGRRSESRAQTFERVFSVGGSQSRRHAQPKRRTRGNDCRGQRDIELTRIFPNDEWEVLPTVLCVDSRMFRASLRMIARKSGSKSYDTPIVFNYFPADSMIHFRHVYRHCSQTTVTGLASNEFVEVGRIMRV